MQQNQALLQFIPFIAIAAIFYFLLIRPQNKQIKETKLMLEALKTGDRVITRGGMLGVITSATATEVEVEIAKGVRTTFVRTAIASVITDKK